jgi:hypothetical protein
VKRKLPTAEEMSAALETARKVVSGETPPRADLAMACRKILDFEAVHHPGGSLEIRVPPFAAVQVGVGERGDHTRGTPPNVVEMDAGTLLALAVGALGWEDALAEHRVHASGIHTDISSWWPIPLKYP